jgi:hypothetical protein
MEAEYITLRGKQYRVEATVGALKKFCNHKGLNDLAAIDKINTTSFDDLQYLIYGCLESGAAMEGASLDFEMSDLFEMMRPADIAVFMDIYKEQSGISSAEVDKKKAQRLKSQPKWWNRLRSKR